MITKREIATVTGVAILGAVLIAVVTFVTGAWGIARNDDWSFILNAFQFHRTGIVAVGGWVQMNLIGQVALAWPVIAIAGDSIAALQALGLACTVVLVIATYTLARLLVPVPLAVFPALAVAVSPVVLPMAASFMTDIPAAAGQVSALALAGYGLVRTRAWLWWSGLLVALWAFSVREYSIAAVAAVLISAWWTRALPRRQAIAGTVGALGVIAAILVWRASQVTETTNVLGFNPDGIPYVWSVPATVGLLMLPAVMLVNPWALLRYVWTHRRWTLAVTLLVLGTCVALAPTLLLGNYLQRTPPYSQVLLGDPEPQFPVWLWAVLVLAGLYGAAITALLGLSAAAEFARAPHRPSPAAALTATFAVLMMVILTVLPMVAKVPLFDRYVISLAAVLPLPLVAFARSRTVIWSSRLPAIGATAVIALAGVTTLLSSSQLDGARWALAESVHGDTAIPRGNIDAGFDWFRFQTNGVPRIEPSTNRYTWWTLDDARSSCVTVSYLRMPTDGDSPVPDPGRAPLATRTVWTPFTDQVLVAHPGPDECP